MNRAVDDFAQVVNLKLQQPGNLIGPAAALGGALGVCRLFRGKGGNGNVVAVRHCGWGRRRALGPEPPGHQQQSQHRSDPGDGDPAQLPPALAGVGDALVADFGQALRSLHRRDDPAQLLLPSGRVGHIHRTEQGDASRRFAFFQTHRNQPAQTRARIRTLDEQPLKIRRALGHIRFAQNCQSFAALADEPFHLHQHRHARPD